MKATNIEWDIDECGVIDDILDYASKEEIAKLLGADIHEIWNMDEDDLFDLVSTALCWYPDLMKDYLKLPSSVELPAEMDKNDAEEWLSVTYGCWLHRFDLVA